MLLFKEAGSYRTLTIPHWTLKIVLCSTSIGGRTLTLESITRVVEQMKAEFPSKCVLPFLRSVISTSAFFFFNREKSCVNKMCSFCALKAELPVSFLLEDEQTDPRSLKFSWGQHLYGETLHSIINKVEIGLFLQRYKFSPRTTEYLTILNGADDRDLGTIWLQESEEAQRKHVTLLALYHYTIISEAITL